MSIPEGEFTFQLKKPLAYKFDGGTHEANFVVLKEPGMEHIKLYLRLKQMLTRAQMELATKAGQLQDTVGEVVTPLKEKTEDEESEIYDMFNISLQASDTVDMGQFIGIFEKMVCTIAKRGICMVDGKLNMTASIWSHLEVADAIEMALRWCSFFAMPSLEGEKTTSVQPQESPTQPMEV